MSLSTLCVWSAKLTILCSAAGPERITHLTKDRPTVKAANGKARRLPTRGHHKKVCATVRGAGSTLVLTILQVPAVAAKSTFLEQTEAPSGGSLSSPAVVAMLAEGSAGSGPSAPAAGAGRGMGVAMMAAMAGGGPAGLRKTSYQPSPAPAAAAAIPLPESVLKKKQTQDALERNRNKMKYYADFVSRLQQSTYPTILDQGTHG